MPYQVTTATKKILALNKRIRAVAGGSSASKTISILMYLIDYAQSVPNKLISVVSESYPHLSGGAMLDFQNILIEQGYWNDERYVKSPKATYTFESGSKIEFISCDTLGKAHGPRRDILFINEANNIEYEIARQLILRTRDFVFLDWNPTHEFWFYTEMLGKRDDIDFITLTYLDNEGLNQTIIKEIEALKTNPNLWKVYGLGQLGEIQGRIYTGWQQVDDIPHEAKLERYGLDFGYSVDPTAIVSINYYNGGYIVKEHTYVKELSNQEIAAIFKNLPRALVMADSAEPKSIAEIASYGINILPCQKGPGSVQQGIQYVQKQRISVTKSSVNLLKEYRKYLWKVDKDGNALSPNVPVDRDDHCMAAIRYGFESLKPLERKPANFQPHTPTFNLG